MASPTTQLAPSVVRAMNILECLAHSRGGATISEISRNQKLPKSSTYVVLKSLEQEGYLQRNVHSGRYYFGPKFVTLSRYVVGNMYLRELARPILGRLMQQTGLSVHLAVLVGDEAVVIDRLEPPGSSAGADWVGRRLDINCTGVGKALAAFLSDEQFKEVIGTKRFARHNENTIVTIDGLQREFARVREQGYALDDEEDEIGVCCIGVPVFDEYKRVLAAISLAGTVLQLSFDRFYALTKALKQASVEITARLSPPGLRSLREIVAAPPTASAAPISGFRRTP